jgi:nucleoside-diphosphate-sugar epimerase
MKILITGVAGHIGTYLMSKIHLIKKIKKIYLIDNFQNNKHQFLFKRQKKIKTIFSHKNLSENNALKNFPKADIVIHLASLTDAESSLSNNKKYFENNLGCFKNVLNYCILNKAKLIHISSTSVYGSQKLEINESCTDLFPQSPYAKIKLIEEKILKNNKNNSLKYITLRFGTITGISNGMRFHTAVNKFCFYAFMRKTIPIWKTAIDQYRPYLSLKDAFKAIKFIIENNIFNNQTYNILTNNLTVRQILRLIKKFINNIRVHYVNSKIMNQLSYKVSKNKFENLGCKLNSNISKDVYETLKIFKIKNII